MHAPGCLFNVSLTQNTNEAPPQTDKHVVQSEVPFACMSGEVLHHVHERHPCEAIALP